MMRRAGESCPTPTMTPPSAVPGPTTPPSPAGAPDAELVARVLAGDRTAFTELVRRHHGPLLRLAQAFVRDRAVAEEVVQDTWLGVLDGLARFEQRSSLKTWIFRILANKARTRFVREARSVPFSALGEGEEGVDPARFDAAGMWQDPPRPWGPEAPERLLEREDAVRVMEAAVAALSAGQRAVITLRDLEDVDPEETCRLLDITMTNQRVLLHRARTKVRAALERHLRGASPC
ncbi:MAG TPA: sigma-70 family RNA polymerase sigma factor [Anaeromyxobacteraceae bacterium]|jgi:RNA polymerase sigma-70 factor (ECF subfamily)|nr:sigma-70 family RNA polymerase sigma factor [Anaeromyxobacteraceae bacterium]